MINNEGSFPAPSARRALIGAPYLDAIAGKVPSQRPIWFMRQAGRSLPEYREIRAKVTMLDSCFDPELLHEITMQPVRRYGVDAAILFSDIVVPMRASGVAVDIVPGRGPVISHPIRRASDLDTLQPLDPAELAPITEGIHSILDELDPSTALIGFAGAPFTLASYLVEGGPSKNHERTKALMLSEPAVWNELMTKIADQTIAFLAAQIDSGVDAVQVFDSWAGALSLADYAQYVQPHTVRIFEFIHSAGVPGTHFGVGTGELLQAMGDVGADMVGVDWRIPLDEAQRRVGSGRALQGNLDPAVLFAKPSIVDCEVRRIVKEADKAIAQGSVGHVFNLGHGVLPQTDPDVLAGVVELVHSL